MQPDRPRQQETSLAFANTSIGLFSYPLLSTAATKNMFEA